MKCVRCSESKSQAGLRRMKMMGRRKAPLEERRNVGQKIKDVKENKWIRSQRRKKGNM